MTQQKNKWPAIALLILTSTIILIIIFPQFVLHPNKYLMASGGDASKNYFTPAWYVAYNTGTHFTGMAYPYGEHITYSDAQPSISVILNLIDDTVYPIRNYTAGILNTLIFLSLIACVVFVYLILKWYGAPQVYAFVFSLLIAFLSPQLERFTGHYALSYCSYFPALWYFYLRCEAARYKLKWVALIIAYITFFGFIQLYYLLIAFIFFIAILFVKLFFKNRSLKESVLLFCMAAIPFLFYFLFMQSTDAVSDRPATPYGFFRYKASFQSIFLPRFTVTWRIWTKNWHLAPPDFEGDAYIGLFGIAAAFILITGAAIKIIKNKSVKNSIPVLPAALNIYLATGIIALLFSMAFPFTLGLHALFDKITPLKQFRSPGRVAWIFYYVFTVYAALLFLKIFRYIKQKNTVFAFIFIALVFLIQGWETYYLFNGKYKYLNSQKIPNFLNGKDDTYKNFLAENNLSQNNFQAILYLPYFLTGSEKLGVDRSNGKAVNAYNIAYSTGLPLIDCMMSRTSVSHTLNLAQMVSNPLIKKNATPQLNEKDVLTVTDGQPLNAGEKFIIQNSIFIGNKNGFDFYQTNPELFKSDEQKKYIDYFNSAKDSLFYSSAYNYYSKDSLLFFYRNDFDSLQSPEPLSGNGSLYLEEGSVNFDYIPINISDTIWVEISFWVKTYVETTSYPYLNVQLLDANKNIIKTTDCVPSFSTDVIDGWVRGEKNFDIPPAAKFIHLFSNAGKKINIDCLVIRHTAYDVYYNVRQDGSFWLNNYPVYHQIK